MGARTLTNADGSLSLNPEEAQWNIKNMMSRQFLAPKCSINGKLNSILRRNPDSVLLPTGKEILLYRDLCKFDGYCFFKSSNRYCGYRHYISSNKSNMQSESKPAANLTSHIL